MKTTHDCPGFGCQRCADEQRDAARVRAELRDRLDRCRGVDFEDALRFLVDYYADSIIEALDATGAPS